MHHTLTGPMRWRWTARCAESHALMRSAEAVAPVGRSAVGADQVRAGRDKGRPCVRSADLAAAASAHGALDARQRMLKGQPWGLSGIHCKHRQSVSPETPPAAGVAHGRTANGLGAGARQVPGGSAAAAMHCVCCMCWRASKSTCRMQVAVCQKLERLLHIQLLDSNVADACHTA